MFETHKDFYAASVNPPRRAKRSVPPPVVQDIQQVSSTSGAPRPIMPAKPYTPRASTSGPDPSDAPPPPAKRGRKPGPLSRTAREAQRRLNHSIIEKARRTKINDALAALKQLVPVNYGQPQKQAADATGSREQRIDDEDEDNDNDEDGDYEESRPAQKSKTNSATSAVKPKGKKEEKEKEFKLEILIRTVSFLEDLLKRVSTLEAAAATSSAISSPPPAPTTYSTPLESQSGMCPTCNTRLDKTRRQHQTKKRKRVPSLDDDGYSTDNDHDERDTPNGNIIAPALRRAKVARHVPRNAPVSPPPAVSPPSIPSAALAAPIPLSAPVAPKAQSPVERLPSISSWLHPMDTVIDPQLLDASCAGPSGGDSNGPGGTGSNSYPSPPASTHFVPVRSTHGQPPLLNLGPVATAAMVVNGAVSSASGSGGAPRAPPKSRTPEDESAASLLLQIASSPPFRAVRSASFSSASSSASISAAAAVSMPAPDSAATASPGTSAARSRAVSTGNGGWVLPDPSNFMLHSGVRVRESERGRGREREWGAEKGIAQQVQTPSSLLGLNLGLGRRY